MIEYMTLYFKTRKSNNRTLKAFCFTKKKTSLKALGVKIKLFLRALFLTQN